MESTMLERLRVESASEGRVPERAALLDRLQSLVTRMREIAAAEGTPAATRAKTVQFLDLLEAAHARLGDALFQPAYALNVVGDALVRTRLLAQPVIDFIQIGLYFHGIKQIERRFRAQSANYLATHADLVSAYVSRAALKDLLDEGERKLGEGKVFCLTYHYLNALKRAYFKSRRQSQDALDHAVADASARERSADRHDTSGADSSDRVGLMLEIFASRLTATQQLVYLAKNRMNAAGAFADVPAFEPFRALFDGLNAELDGHGNLGWSEIAAKLLVNEKTAKREYIRALHILLRECAQAVFGMNITSNYVRRTLEQLRLVVDAKDLRLRGATGDGLPRLVEKWEVALRFVLNHDRALA